MALNTCSIAFPHTGHGAYSRSGMGSGILMYMSSTRVFGLPFGLCCAPERPRPRPRRDLREVFFSCDDDDDEASGVAEPADEPLFCVS